MPRQTFQSPKGTRDFYPQDLLIRRYITDAWRRVALRHGFDEIDGPTFETSALYKVKSGDAILGEMFGVFSGKDPEDVAAAGRGDPPFVLRPEFTPSLARMYAAKAAQLPKPTKWFCVPNFFRAERQQRGRLREFMQWNCDVIGLEAGADVEVVAVLCSALSDLGLTHESVRVRFSHKAVIELMAQLKQWGTEHAQTFSLLLDKRAKLSREQFIAEAVRLNFTVQDVVDFEAALGLTSKSNTSSLTIEQFNSNIAAFAEARVAPAVKLLADSTQARINVELGSFVSGLTAAGYREWATTDFEIARGLAYYTGTVFEVIAEGERAVAGGGRYDNLVELFGGPPTPACGFGMGDVVLGNLLTDKGLMPEGKDLLTAVSRPMPVRPDAFVIAASDEAAAHVTPLVAQLRRGIESPRYKDSLTAADPAQRMKPWDKDRYAVEPLHARRSYKATKNVGKLLADASACHARFAVILESPEKATIKNLDTGAQDTIPTSDIGTHITRQ